MPEPVLSGGLAAVTLIGMPGGGKSTVGRLVAKRLGTTFSDIDRLIEDRAGCTIRDFFERHGEQAFRQMEQSVLAERVAAGGVIATGGGAVLAQENRDLLRAGTHCVYLHVHHQTLWNRLKRDRKRPIMQVADPERRLTELMAERHPLYLSTATAVVETAGLSLDQVIHAVIDGLPAKTAHAMQTR